MKIKPCPFCGAKAELRSPEKLRTRSAAIMSDISCTEGCVWMSNYWPWDAKGKELPRQEQDKLIIANWNKRKK